MTTKVTLAFWRGDLLSAFRYNLAAKDFGQGQDYLGLQQGLHAHFSWISSVQGNYQHAYSLCQSVEKTVLPNVAFDVFWGLALAHCGLGNIDAAWKSLLRSLTHAYHYTNGSSYQQLCLPIAAVLNANAGNAERASHLIGLTYSAPKALMGWLDQWQLFRETRKQLENTLGADTYAELLTSGANLKLESVVGELLAGFSEDNETNS